MNKIFLGLMSGTSLDAVDAVAISFDSDEQMKLLGTHSLALTAQLRADILALTQPSDNEIESLGRVDVEIAQLFAQCANQLREKLQLNATQITAIGSHGQTIRHRPYLTPPFTLQIADPNIIAELTGITVVADFRRRDVAAGGQGAPLVPAFHEALLHSDAVNRVVLNLGGMANITVLPADTTQIVYGYDTGPANVLMDAWCWRHLQQSYDKNGVWAASGNIIPSLLEQLLLHPFFAKKAPKSTGREDFHLDWLLPYIKAEYQAQDVQATLLELTAISVAQEINALAFAEGELFLCGGGAYNHALWQSLAQKLPNYRLLSTETIAIAPTWIEATAFAWLAKQTMEGLSGNLPAVTGAAGRRILGGIYQA
ncbi:MAG: anhydro-N-acetylmuramic acid kinase [Moraxellaceae bacterium]|nr:anhydro-N-acetylmuramic acid kinase [Pseudomonadales bacterium]MCP5175763.1 anhydro-N-acetylmuramic acid kinase [Moraxellaceae bacterium]MCP5176965.1 anhydro-N-acetylmuramic acid kinase [Moraxellaceae bacterium]HQV22208.1 anhydro-N-acetylmuramic acid kinase [Agitococcus sp.]